MRILIPLFLLLSIGVFSPLLAQDSRPKSRQKSPAAPYPLSVCPVTGEDLGSMGGAVVHVHEGSEVRFCCKGCLPKFKKDPAKYLAKIDKLIIEQQLPTYPTDTCVVSDESIAEHGEKPVNLVVQNRLVRLCCNGCKRDFAKDPSKYLAKLDEAIIAQQKDHYPLNKCVVTGKELGSMGKPINVVVANRLFKLCCAGCKKKLLKEPGKYLAMLGEVKKPEGEKSAEKKHDHEKGEHDH